MPGTEYKRTKIKSELPSEPKTPKKPKNPKKPMSPMNAANGKENVNPDGSSKL